MRIDIQEKSFGDAQILGAVRIDVGDMEKIALTGPSGIGKSTLLRLIAGLDTDFEGSVTNVGKLAFVFQEPTLLPWRTAQQNLTITTGVSKAEARELLQSVGLADKADLFPTQLSLGQRRRIAIVRAFARQPDTLLMDEPFASLDPDAALGIKSLLRTLLNDRPTRLVLVTHAASEADELADRIVRLEGSPARIVGEGA